MRKTTVKKMMFGIASTCVLMTESMMAFAGTWQQTNNQWHFYNDAGQMVAGQLITDNNQLYYIGADGVMQTGFVPVNGVYYYFTPAGNMQTGWVFDNNAWYYMQTDATHFGQMTVNASQNVNGKSYYFGADGKMVNNTTIGQTTYGADGAAVTGTTNVNAGVNTNTGSTNPVVTNLMINGVAVAGGQDLDLSELSKYGINLGNMDVGGNLNPVTSFNHDQYVREIFNLVNQERVTNGLEKLTLSNELCNIADVRAKEIYSNFSHNGFDAYSSDIKNDFNTIYVSENIAKWARNASEVMSGWMNSSGHRANILNGNFENIGIGIYQSEGGRLYYSQVFAG